MTKGTREIASEFQFLPYGEIQLEGEGSVYVDDAAMDQIIEHFNQRGNDIVIDYEHETLTGKQAPAAGWIKRLVNRGKQGLWAAVEWTEKAKQYLANREYRYFSPVFLFRKSDNKVIQILNAALTNTPKINRLKPIVAKIDFNGQDLDEATLKIASLFDLNEEDIRKYGGVVYDHDPCGINEESLLKVAKLMGNTKEDIEMYGDMHFDAELVESDEAKIARLLGNK